MIRKIVVYGILAAFLAWCFVAFEHDIEQISWISLWHGRQYVAIAASLSLLNYLLRIIRWQIYFRALGYHLPFGFSALTYMAGFAFTLSPGKLGELVRARYYTDRGVPLSSSAAAFFVERLMDLLAMVLLGMVALAAASRYDHMLWVAVFGMAGILLVLAIMPWIWLQSWLESRAWLSDGLKRLAGRLLRTLISARRLLRPSLLIGGFFISVLAWGAEGIGLGVLGGLVPSVPVDWERMVGIYSVAVIVGALSFLPGGLGGTEAVMAALLAGRGYSMADALLLTLTCRILTLWFAVVIGWCAVWWIRLRSPNGNAKERST